MKPFEKIKRGMGVGGWIANYKRGDFLPKGTIFFFFLGNREHFERYLTEWDVQNIKALGMDHIRIPFAQYVVEEYDKPFSYREDMLKLLDRMIGWCLDAGLEVVLNLHHAIGDYANIPGQDGLLDSKLLTERFIRLWEMLEDRYHDLDIIFEPLNEITTTDCEK